jgi:tetratricopeptide (TPR) repeat protein
MRKVVVIVFLAAFSANIAFSQAVAPGFDLSNYGVKIEPDKRVIVVLAALEAARTENEKGEPVPVVNTRLSEQGSKFRDQLKSDLAALNENLRNRISTFVLAHKRRNPKLTDEQLIAPFISMAYTLGPVPDLADPVVTSDLPGSLLDVLDFAPLVRDLYRTTNIGANLGEYVKTYQAAADTKLRPSARVMVNELLNYLHTRPQLTFIERVKTETPKQGSKKVTVQKTEVRERERRFSIVPEMLAPAGFVNFVNVRDDYYVVVSPDTDLANSEVRRAYLQFVVDPLVLSNAKDIESVRPAVKQLLDDRRKIDPTTSPDVFLTISRSLVAAVDAKQLEHSRVAIATSLARQKILQAKTEPDKLKISGDLEKYKKAMADETALRLSEDYEKGALLAFYFANELRGVEQSEFDIAGSMREMILSFDAAKEAGRYESFADARARAKAARDEQKKNALAAPSFVENPVTTSLLEIQNTIKAKNYPKAEADLKKLLESNPAEPRILFNVGRLAAISAEMIDGNTEAEKQKARYLEAKTAFESVVRIAADRYNESVQKNDPSLRVDPALVSLAYVSLGRIYEYYEQKSYAVSIYDAAIKLGDVVGGGYQEALASKQRLLKDQ